MNFPRPLIAGSAALVLLASGLGAYSVLKPTATASAPIASAALATTAFADEEASTATVYTIQADDSEARFIIDEVLRDSPFTVVGTTDQVAGQISFDSKDPSTAQVGPIVINARTLTTDDSSRNRALGNFILNTSDYEYITFIPAGLSGLPASVTPDQPFTFQVTGDLTIRDEIHPAVFDVTVVPGTDGSLAGNATTTIKYADWGLSIPSVPFVASVDDDVTLQLDFAATAAA